ncbi:hypothetical protein BGZ65_006969, partial [Modicella reniformis]
LAPVAKQGGGLINVKNAVSVKTLFSPDKIELLDSVHFAGKSVEVTIKNLDTHSTVYTLSHENDKATVKFSSTKVTVRAGKTTKVKIQFTEPSTGKTSEFPFYSGYIVATPQGKDAVPVRIPYAGVKGDIAQVPILDTDYGVPILVLHNKQTGKVGPAEKGQKINWAIEQPYVFARLGSHTPELSLRLYNAATNTFAGFLNTQFGILASEFGRNKNVDANGKPVVKNYSWNQGKVFVDRNATAPVNVPAGEYKVVVAAQHKLSKGNYPADFEVYEVAVVKF